MKPHDTIQSDSASGSHPQPDQPGHDQPGHDGQGSEPQHAAAERSPAIATAPAQAASSQPGGRQWLLRVGIKFAAVILVAVTLFSLVGLAQWQGWLTTGASGIAADAGDGEAKRYICPMM